jgi:hypothetical protein
VTCELIMNRFKKAGTILRAFSRTGDSKGLLSSDSERTEDQSVNPGAPVPAGSGAEGSDADSKQSSGSNPTKKPGYNEQSAEPAPRRTGGLLKNLSDRKMLGGVSEGYCDVLSRSEEDDDISVNNLDDEGNEIKGGEALTPEERAKRIGELPTKPSMDADKSAESTQGRRRPQQAPRRGFRKTKAKEEAEATVIKTDNEDLEATVAQVEGGEGGYSQLVLSERSAPEQRPDSSHGDDDSVSTKDNEDKASPKEEDRRVKTKGPRPKDKDSLSRKPKSGGPGAQKERPRKPGEKRPTNASDGTRRRSNEHEPVKRSDRPTTKGAPSTPTGGQKAPVGEIGALGELNISPKEEEILMPKVAKAKGKPKERELMQHLSKPAAKTGRDGMQRVNSSKSMFIRGNSSKNMNKGEGMFNMSSSNLNLDKGDIAGEETSPMSVRERGVRTRVEKPSHSEKGAGSGSFLGRMQSAVSERNLLVSSEHTPSVLGPGNADTVSRSEHGEAVGPDLGPPSSLDLGPAATDSATLMALTTLSWTTRPPSPTKKKGSAKPKSPDAEETEPDATAVVSEISFDPDGSTKNKASKDTKNWGKIKDSVSSKPRRDGKESSSKRNESSSSKSKRDGKDESTGGKHTRESRNRSRPESRARGQSVNPTSRTVDPVSRTRGTSVRAQARSKKPEPDAPSDRRQRRASMENSKVDVDGQGDKLSSEGGFERPTGQLGRDSETATAQIDNPSNDFSAGNVPTSTGPEDAGRPDTTSKAAEGEVVKEPKDLGSPSKSPMKKNGQSLTPSKSPSKQNGARKPGNPNSPKKPTSPRSPRRGHLASPRHRAKHGSSPTASSPQISLQLAMALTGPPNLEEEDESIISDVDVKARAEQEKNAGLLLMPDIHRSEDGDEASDEPLFEDWSDAADSEGLLESFGASPRHPQNAAQAQRAQETVGQAFEDWSDAADDEGMLESFKGSEHSRMTGQGPRAEDSVGNRVEEWSDAADESDVANQEESLRQSTVADQEKFAQGLVGDEGSDKAATAHTETVPETIVPEGTKATDDVVEALNGDASAKESLVNDTNDLSTSNLVTQEIITSASPKAADTLESGVGTRELIATEEVDNNIVASTGSALDGATNLKDGEHVRAIPKHLKTDESADDLAFEKSKSKISEGLDKEHVSNDGTDLDHAESQQQSTDSVDGNQVVETSEGDENEYGSSSVYALLSSELAGSKERLTETRLEVSQLVKEVDLLRLRLNTLEKTLS